MRKKHYISLVLFGLSCFLYYLIAYHTPRTQTAQLLLAESGLFVIYFYWLKNSLGSKRFFSAKLFGIVFRLLFLFSIPQLSDDVYRFIWDGKLMVNGINPFRFLPTELKGTPFFEANRALFDKLNSPNYYSVYPPLNQLFFWITALFSGGNEWMNIVLLRIVILGAEVGVFYLTPGPSPQERGNASHCYTGESVVVPSPVERGNAPFCGTGEGIVVPSAVERGNAPFCGTGEGIVVPSPVERGFRGEVYWLNPLVIIELTGNLHFEAVVIFFLVMTYHLLKKQRNNWAAVAFSAAVLAKLLPLIFLPLIFSKLGFEKGIKFGLLVFLICVGAGAFFFDIPLLLHLLASVKLYFNNFEFNASLYYILREIGYSLVGYNIIGITGKLLSSISLALILFLSFAQKTTSFPFKRGQGRGDIQRASLILAVYLLFATTVHPWYITPLVAMAALGGLQFPLVWSAIIPFTYLAYRQTPFHENLWVVVFEYVIVGIFFVREMGISSISPTKKAKK